MIILFISLCLILLGLFLSIAFKDQPMPVPQKVKVMETPHERYMKKIIEDISMN